MSVSQYGPTCEPAQDVDLFGLGPVRTAEPTHTHCPGGQHTPGLIGGWTCPCDCHRSASAAASLCDSCEQTVPGVKQFGEGRNRQMLCPDCVTTDASRNAINEALSGQRPVYDAGSQL